MRRRPRNGGEGRRAVASGECRGASCVKWRRIATVALVVCAALVARRSPLAAQDAPLRIDRGRFTVVCYPGDEKLASALLARALATDTFPGLPRPSQRVLIAIAPDQQRFREWAGPGAPEWGSALAFPDTRRVVMQGRNASSDAGDPFEVLRHELAHLALHEYLGDLPPRWFDEGYASYAARELSRNDVLAANFTLALRGMPTFDELDDRFGEGATSAQAAYALAYRAVDDMASIDPSHGLALLLQNWKKTGTLDRALRASFGTTLASFEHEWQQRTRRRYGGLALFSDITVASIIFLVLVAPLYLARRRRDRRRMAALVAADALAEPAAAPDVLATFIEAAPEHGGTASDEGTESGGRG
jgi:peptidase MA superfamily protein